MPPKDTKKKAVKVLEKKSVKVISVAQVNDVADFDESDLLGDEGDIHVDQLHLEEDELNKDVTIILTAENPYFSEEFVEFSFKDLEYKTISNFPNTVTVFSQSGNVIHKSTLESTEEGKTEEENSEPKRRNKFNFCDRAVQTMNLAMRNQYVQTETAASAKLNFNATLWAITSAYTDQMEQITREIHPAYVHTDTKFRQVAKNTGFENTAQFVDRMINQNRFFDITIDSKYYDNPSDEILGEGMGSLLPLWKFHYKPMKGIAVTAMCWNHLYSDLFAASFGTTEFVHENKGCICIFTLKCTLLPARVFNVESAVQCIDFSKSSPHLLAAGLTDGRVLVFDLRFKSDEPILSSQCCKLQHNDVVGQIKWLRKSVEEKENFCSVSSDGRVINWCIAKSELIPRELVYLKNEDCVTMGPEGSPLCAVSCGTSVSFSNDSMDLFIVGSQEGITFKCSDLYSAMYLSKYQEHSNAVYSVEFNPFHPRVFLSCSADWTIRIWDHLSQKSVFMFDMFSEVETASWAPFSSTLLAAITKDGKVHVFDLMMNRQQPTCTLLVHGQKKQIPLTSVCFNPTLPILMVGDARGGIMSYKLSPNLRSSLKGFTEIERSKFKASEVDKMEKVLKLAKSPDQKEKSDN